MEKKLFNSLIHSLTVMRTNKILLCVFLLMFLSFSNILAQYKEAALLPSVMKYKGKTLYVGDTSIARKYLNDILGTWDDGEGTKIKIFITDFLLPEINYHYMPVRTADYIADYHIAAEIEYYSLPYLTDDFRNKEAKETINFNNAKWDKLTDKSYIGEFEFTSHPFTLLDSNHRVFSKTRIKYWTVYQNSQTPKGSYPNINFMNEKRTKSYNFDFVNGYFTLIYFPKEPKKLTRVSSEPVVVFDDYNVINNNENIINQEEENTYVSETIINLYNKSSSPLFTSPGDNSTCQLQADVDCSNPQEKAGRTVRIEFVNQQIGSFNTTEAVTDANGKAYFTYTAPDENTLQGKDNIKVEVKAVDVKSGKETYYVPIEIYKRDSKSTFAAQHLIMPQGSKYYNEIKLSINAPPKGTGYSAAITTKDPLGLITTSKTDPNGSSLVVDNLVPGKVYTLYYHNTGSSTLSAPIEDQITLEISELGVLQTINISVGMDLAIQTVERKYKTGTTYPAVPEPIVISVVDNFHPDADLEKIFNDFDIKMRVRISPSNVSQTSVLSKVQEDWCSRLLTKFEGFMFGENIVTTSGDAIVTIKKSPEGKYTLCKTDREVLPFVMMFDRGTYDFTAELIDIGFPENLNNNSGSVTLSVEQYRDGVDEFLKTALIPIAKSLIDITTGGLMKYGDFAAASADLVLYKDAVSEGKLQDALMLLFGMYCDKLENSEEFFNVITKEIKPLTDKSKILLKLNSLASNILEIFKNLKSGENKGGGINPDIREVIGDFKYSQLILKGMKDYYFIVMDKSGLKNYSATLKTGNKLLPSADKVLNAKSTDERIESDNDYILIPFENSESASLSLDFSGSGGFLYRVTKDNIDKVEFPKNTSSVKLDISSTGSLSLGKQETKKEEPKSSSFSGSWETADFGTVSFIIAGNDAVATCTKNLAGMKGKLSSDGTKITGTWAKFPTYSSPNDAGKFEITISSDGKSFTGNWGKGTDSSAKLDKPLTGKKK